MFKEIPRNCKYAYARVSSKSQQDNSSLEAQKQEFKKLGVPESSISDQTALQGIIFLNEDCTIERVN